MFGNSINSVFDTGIPSSVLSIAMVVILLMQIFLVTGMQHRTDSGRSCGDLIAEGKMKAEQVDDLGDVLMGNIPVHRKEGEIVIYSVGGMPVEDVAWGTIVYRNALERCSSGLFVLKKKISLRVEWIYAILSMNFLHLHINKKKMLIHLEPVLIY